MIRGDKITLRTIKETDLAAYYALLADVQNKGAYYPQQFQSYPDFQKGYHNRGCWHEVSDHGVEGTGRDWGSAKNSVKFQIALP